jgi:hypothetical protein
VNERMRIAGLRRFTRSLNTNSLFIAVACRARIAVSDADHSSDFAKLVSRPLSHTGSSTRAYLSPDFHPKPAESLFHVRMGSQASAIVPSRWTCRSQAFARVRRRPFCVAPHLARQSDERHFRGAMKSTDIPGGGNDKAHWRAFAGWASKCVTGPA